VAELAAQLATELTAGMVSATGVTDYAGVLQAVFVALMVWFKEFLALYCSTYALI